MSRTDVHRPYRVQIRDPHIRRWFTDHHDHATGPCDLEVLLAAPDWTRTRCTRQPHGRCPNLCGCPLCTGQPGRKLARRQERGAWRRTRARLLAEVRAGSRDLDTPPSRRKAW